MQSFTGLALMVPQIIRGSPWTFKRQKKPGLNRVKRPTAYRFNTAEVKNQPVFSSYIYSVGL